MLVGAGPALAAGDIETCRDAAAEAEARLAACESVIADDKITGKTKGAAFCVSWRCADEEARLRRRYRGLQRGA